MPTFRTHDGARLHYLDVGRGPACVMLHGFGMQASMWLPFALSQALRHRFILLDFRGFGGSAHQRLAQPDILRQNADDLHELVDHLRLDGCHLAGFSLGAATALQYQRQHGLDRFGAYLHIDQAPCIRNSAEWRWGLGGPHQAGNFERGRALVAAFDGVDRARRFGALPRPLRRQFWAFFGDFFREAFRQPVMRAAGNLLRSVPTGRLVLNVDNWGVYVDCIRAYQDQDYDFRESLRALRVPLSVFVGMDSAAYPAEGQLRILDYVPHAHIVPFERCGHSIPFEAPLRFGRALGQFLQHPRPLAASLRASHSASS